MKNRRRGEDTEWKKYAKMETVKKTEDWTLRVQGLNSKKKNEKKKNRNGEKGMKQRGPSFESRNESRKGSRCS